MLAFLTSAIGGSLAGGLLKLVTDWSDSLRQERMLKVEMQAKQQGYEWSAFGKSQESSDSFRVPSGVWPWVSSVVTLLLGLVEAFRRFTRPGLTWLLLAFLWHTYGAASATAKEALLADITFGAFTALFWWFGERYSASRKPTRK